MVNVSSTMPGAVYTACVILTFVETCALAVLNGYALAYYASLKSIKKKRNTLVDMYGKRVSASGRAALVVIHAMQLLASVAAIIVLTLWLWRPNRGAVLTPWSIIVLFALVAFQFVLYTVGRMVFGGIEGDPSGTKELFFSTLFGVFASACILASVGATA